MSIEQCHAKTSSQSVFVAGALDIGQVTLLASLRTSHNPRSLLPTYNNSSEDEGFAYVGAATSAAQTNAAMMAFRSGTTGKGWCSRPSQAQSSMVRANDATSSDSGARVTPSSVERPNGFDTVFQIGQFKGKTYWVVLHRQPQFYVWTKKESSRVPGIQQYVQWVDQIFDFRGGEIYLRDDEPVQPPRDTRFVAHVCVVGMPPPGKGKRNHNSSLKIAHMNPPITGDQVVRLIARGASNDQDVLKHQKQ